MMTDLTLWLAFVTVFLVGLAVGGAVYAAWIDE